MPLIGNTVPDGPVALVLSLQGFVPAGSRTRKAEIRVNGGAPQAVTIDASQPLKDVFLNVPGETLKAQNGLDIRFNIMNPVSPAELHLSTDRRRLGLGLKSLTLHK